MNNIMRFRSDPLTFLTDAARTKGAVAHYGMANRRVYLLSEPELIKDLLITSSRKFHKSIVLQRSKSVLGNGLLTSEDDFHLRQRRLAQPAFHRQRVANYGSVMTEYAERRASSWKAGEPVDIHREMMRLTLAIAGKTLFNADVEGESRVIGESLDTFMQLFGIIFLPFSDLLEKLPLPAMIRLRRARRTLDTIVYRMIHERRASGADTGDLLSMLLQAQDAEGTGSMTDEQVRDECLTILLAGHETTANALTWTWMLLAQNPAAEAELHRELDSVLGRGAAAALPTLDHLPQLRYTEMVFAESMRLYPPAWSLGRMNLEDHRFGEVNVPAGSIVLASQWVMHRDARYYPEPLRFDPMRWTPEQKATRPRFAYFPFGAGPRQCIGESFAWMEGVLLLATIARRWKMEVVPKQKIKPVAAITLRPGNGVHMRLQPR